MAAAVELGKPAEASLAIKEQRPKRDFLREHREYLRTIQKGQKTAKTKSAKSASCRDPGESLTVARKRPDRTSNDIRKAETSNRSSAKIVQSKSPGDKRFATFISKTLEPRMSAGGPNVHPNMLDEYVQTCDPEIEVFLEGARILSPSNFILEAIRVKKEPPVEAQTRPVKRRINRHTSTLNAHLSDLKEFLEKGSVSRRKRNETQKNPNIQKYLARNKINVRARNNRSNIETEAKKVTVENTIVENIKTSILFGAGESAEKPIMRAAKMPRMSKKDAIGDGPKRAEDNKLIVVYQKE